MAKSRKQKKPTVSQARRRRAVEKSMREVKQAQKNLDLKIRRHHAVMTAMFFPA